MADFEKLLGVGTRIYNGKIKETKDKDGKVIANDEMALKKLVNEAYAEARQMASKQLSWHVGFFSNIMYWITQVLIVFSYITIVRNRKSYQWIVSLFSFSLLIYSLS